MKLYFFLFIFALAACINLASTAQAQVVHCGVPDEVRVPNAEFEFCDIFQRQLAYREKRLLLVEDIKERQKSFAAPSIEARKQYQKDLQALHNSIKE